MKESNREMAISFLSLAASGKIKEAYERYVSPDFKHHNQYFPGDRTSLMKGMEESSAKNPDKRFDVKLVLSEGDMVATYSHVRQTPSDIGAAVVHIMRFKEGKIAEMWDVGQAIQKDSVNKNGMF